MYSMKFWVVLRWTNLACEQVRLMIDCLSRTDWIFEWLKNVVKDMKPNDFFGSMSGCNVFCRLLAQGLMLHAPNPHLSSLSWQHYKFLFLQWPGNSTSARNYLSVFLKSIIQQSLLLLPSKSTLNHSNPSCPASNKTPVQASPPPNKHISDSPNTYCDSMPMMVAMSSHILTSAQFKLSTNSL